MGELVCLTLDDTTSVGGSAGAWMTPAQIERQITTPIEAAGWVVHRDERFVTLAGLRDSDPNIADCGSVIRVPWGSVTKVERLVRRPR